MKKIFKVFMMIAALAVGCFAQNSPIRQEASPPILMGQNLLQTAVQPAIGLQQPLVPGNIAPPPPPAPPVPVPGIPVVQTVPAKTLLANLPSAIATAQKIEGQLRLGKVWLMRAPAGELEIKAGILYQGFVISVLRLNPADGSVLPLGVNPHVYQSSFQLGEIKTRLATVLNRLKILPAAEFMEPEVCWSFPVVSGNTIVAHIKIYYDGVHVVQDYMANQEMTFYGQ